MNAEQKVSEPTTTNTASECGELPQPNLEAIVEATSQRTTSLLALAATALHVPADKLLDLLRNTWKTSKGQPPLTNAEMFAGLSMIARFNLDPIAKEVYVTRDKNGRLMTIVGIDGWIKILDRTEHYDGFEMQIHEDADGAVDWVECSIYSKLRSHPVSYRAYRREYEAVCGFVAGQLPIHMLRLFALRHAARLFVPLGADVQLEEEAGFIERNQNSKGARMSSVKV